MSSPELTIDLPEAAEVYPIYVTYLEAEYAAGLFSKIYILTPEEFATKLWATLPDDQKEGQLEKWQKGIIDAQFVMDSQQAYQLYLQSQQVRQRVETALTSLDEAEYRSRWETMDTYIRLREVRNYRHVINGTPLEESVADIIKRFMRRKEASATTESAAQ
jgi:hypothetical protein